jgi:6-pyruvoyltetrahydropterin/6-carboxytetrahydropterin synthase
VSAREALPGASAGRRVDTASAADDLLHLWQFDEWAASDTALALRQVPALAAAPRVQLACTLPPGRSRPGGPDRPQGPAGPGGPDRASRFAGDEQPLLQQLGPLIAKILVGRTLGSTAADRPDEALAGAVATVLRKLGGRLQRLSLQWGARTGLHRFADGPVMLHWRRYRFQSAHRLPHVPAGHKCGRLHGHGFEAVVTARDTPPSVLDAAWAPWQLQLQHQTLNTLPGLENPTSEHLARWLWQRLQPSLPGLHGISIYETASCGAHASGDGTTLRIWKDLTLDAATRLAAAPADHPRARWHGCTYTLRLHLAGELDPVLGWAVDFGDVKSAIAPVFDALDHHAVTARHRPRSDPADRSDPPDAAGDHPGDVATLARWVLDEARERLPLLTRVDLFEAPGCGVSAGPAAALGPWLPLRET